MTATVTEKMQVSLPPDICAELGIEPGAQLDFRAHNGRLEAIKISPSSKESLKQIYTPERDTEELTIQNGCSCEVPEDFPK